MARQFSGFFTQIDRHPRGAFVGIPVNLSKKFALQRRIASELSSETKYPEKELNAIIVKYHDDSAALRRYMNEYGISERKGLPTNSARSYCTHLKFSFKRLSCIK